MNLARVSEFNYDSVFVVVVAAAAAAFGERVTKIPEVENLEIG